MDAMLSETTKANGIPSTNDQGALVIGTKTTVEEVVVNDTTIHASNLPEVCGATVKRRKVNGNKASALDCFTESSALIEKMKMEIAFQFAQDNKKFCR